MFLTARHHADGQTGRFGLNWRCAAGRPDGQTGWLGLQVLLLFLAALLSVKAIAESSNDLLAAESKVEDALAGPLHTVTVATTSLEESLLFYRDGLGLQVEGPIDLSRKVKARQRALWGIPKTIDWELYFFSRQGVAEAATIRLLVLDTPTPSIHSDWSALALGPFSMGFPNTVQTALDAKMRRLGFGALNELEKYNLPRRDGTEYPMLETIFNGPDFVHAVGIYRGGDMMQLGPVEENSGMGGPAYSALVVEDSDAMIDFLVDVLGLELRSDRMFKSAGSKGALNVPDGTVFRFSIIYSKGATTGHLLLVDYQNQEPVDNGVAPRLPNRGIGMWTFPVSDLQQVLSNAAEAGIKPYAKPVELNTPTTGKSQVATFLAPNGFLIEVFEELP